MGLRKDSTYLQFRNAVPNTALAWNNSGVPYHMGVFTPATSLLDGTIGLIPKPVAGQHNYILSNNGWIPNTGGSGGSGAYPDLVENTTIDGASTHGFHIENISNFSLLVLDSGSSDTGELDIGNNWIEFTIDSDFGYLAFDNSTGNSNIDFYAGNGIQMTLGGSTGLAKIQKLSASGYEGAFSIDGTNSLVQLSRTTITSQVTKIEIGGSEIGTTNVGNVLVTGIAGNFQGVRYAADYQAQYTDRSLVDKNFVLTQIALGGAAIINTAGVNEIPKSASAVSIVPTGIFSTAIGSISLGTGLAGTSRYVAADGSAADVGLKLYTKGNGIMDFAFGGGGAILGDTTLSGGRVLTVGSSGSSADLFIYSKGASSVVALANSSAGTAYFKFDASNQTINLERAPATANTTFQIAASGGYNATFPNGDGIYIKAGNGFSGSGDGSGGNAYLQAGVKRTGGAGLDGNIFLHFRDGILHLGDGNYTGNRLVQVGSGDPNASLTIRPKGTGALNLGLSTAAINFVGTVFQLNGVTGSSGQFMRYDGTWATPSTGTPFTNTAAASEIPKSASSTSIAPSGLFSYTHGDLTLGTDVAANRNIWAEGSSATVDLRLWPKGGSGKIILGVTTGALIVGSTLSTGDRALLCGSSDTNASLYIQTAGTGTVHIGYATNMVNLVASTLKMNGVAGAAGQFLRYDMTWQTPAGGLTNTAATNELMKSSGGNAVPSGLFSTTDGNLNLGTASLTGDRTIQVLTASASGDLILAPAAIGNLVLGTSSAGTVLIGNSTSGTGRKILVQSNLTDDHLYIYPKGGGHIELGTTATGIIYIGTGSTTGDRQIQAQSSSTSAALTITQKGFGNLNLGNAAGGTIVNGATVALAYTTSLTLGLSTTSGNRTVVTGSTDTNASLTITQKGTGTLNLGIVTGIINLVGTLNVNGAGGASGTFLAYDGTWQTPGGGVSNSAFDTEIPRTTGGSGNLTPSGVFNPSHGNINLGSDAGTSRYLQATGSGSNLDLRIIPKGTGLVITETTAIRIGSTSIAGSRAIDILSSSTHAALTLYPKGDGDVALATSSGGWIMMGNSALAGGRLIVTGSSDTNADLSISAKGTGHLYLGVTSGAIFLGTTTSTGSTRYIQPAGSSGTIKMFIYPKGAEDIELAVPDGRTVWIGNASDTGNKSIKLGTSSTNADLLIEQKGLGWVYLGNTSGFLNFRAGTGVNFYIRSIAGLSNQFFGYDGWRVPVDTLMMAMDVAAPKAAPMAMMVDAEVTPRQKGERVLDFLRGLIQEELTKRGLI